MRISLQQNNDKSWNLIICGGPEAGVVIGTCDAMTLDRVSFDGDVLTGEAQAVWGLLLYSTKHDHLLPKLGVNKTLDPRPNAPLRYDDQLWWLEDQVVFSSPRVTIMKTDVLVFDNRRHKR